MNQIWDMSDPQGKGFLDKSGVFLSLKLIVLAQTGRDVSMPNALQDLNELPEMSGEKPVIKLPTGPPQMEIAEEMLLAYQKMFTTVAEPSPNPGQPMCVPGNKVSKSLRLSCEFYILKLILRL